MSPIHHPKLPEIYDFFLYNSKGKWIGRKKPQSQGCQLVTKNEWVKENFFFIHSFLPPSSFSILQLIVPVGTKASSNKTDTFILHVQLLGYTQWRPSHARNPAHTEQRERGALRTHWRISSSHTLHEPSDNESYGPTLTLLLRCTIPI